MKSHWEIPFYSLNAIFFQYFTEYVDNLGCVLWFCDDCVYGFFFNEIVHNLISYQCIHKTLNRKYSKCFCTQLHEHFHLFTFQMYNAFENCILVIELTKEISFQADPLPQIYYFHCYVSRVTNKIEIFPFSKPVCCIIFWDFFPKNHWLY